MLPCVNLNQMVNEFKDIKNSKKFQNVKKNSKKFKKIQKKSKKIQKKFQNFEIWLVPFNLLGEYHSSI